MTEEQCSGRLVTVGCIANSSARSERNVVEPGPTDAQLDLILKAGVRAPDHGRLAPWRFIVVEGQAREILGKLFGAAKQHANAERAGLDVTDEVSKAFRAPTIIAVAACVQSPSKIPALEQMIAVGAAVQNMFLAAHALGLGVMWKTGLAAYDKGVKVSLGLKEQDLIVAFLYLGSVEKLPAPRPAELVGRVSWLK